jgi:plastocyanin
MMMSSMGMRNRILRGLIGVGLAALLGAPLAMAFSRDVVVEVYHDHIRPHSVLLSIGDTVVFVYKDNRPGGVLVLEDGSAQSPPMRRNQSWSRTFWEPGRYRYYMRDRPGVRGSVTVR